MAKKSKKISFFSILFAIVTLALAICGIFSFYGEVLVYKFSSSIVENVDPIILKGFEDLLTTKNDNEMNIAVLVSVIMFSVAAFSSLVFIITKFILKRESKIPALIMSLTFLCILVGAIFSFLPIQFIDNYNFEIGELLNGKMTLGTGTIFAGIIGITGSITSIISIAFDARK